MIIVSSANQILSGQSLFKWILDIVLDNYVLYFWNDLYREGKNIYKQRVSFSSEFGSFWADLGKICDHKVAVAYHELYSGSTLIDFYEE